MALLIALMAVTVASLSGCGGDSTGSGATVGMGASTAAPDGKASTGPGAGSSEPVLSDAGLGELKLNMSLEKAQALGWTGKAEGVGTSHVCDTYAGRRGVEQVVFSHDKLIIIVAGPEIRLDTGLGVGSTYADFHEKYGDRLGSDEGLHLQRVYLTAPGAEYRLGLDTPDAFRDSKITSITLQSLKQTCHE